MREVEAQALRAHRGAGLAHVLAEPVAQRALQQMGAGVVGHRRAPARHVDARVHGVAHAQLAVEAHEQRLVAVEPVDRLDLAAHGVRADLAAVGDLAAALRIERRARELDEREALADRLDREHLRLDLELVVAHELAARRRAREARDALVVHAIAAPGGRAGALALRLHVPLEALEVDAEPGLARELGGQLDGKAVRVVQLEDVARVERRLAAARAPARSARRAGASPSASVCEKRVLLGLEQAADVVAVLRELGIAGGRATRSRPRARRRGTASRGRGACRAGRRAG